MPGSDYNPPAENSISKRKRVDLTIPQKIELLQKLDNGVKVTELCSFYKIGHTTVYDIKKNKEKLLQNYEDSHSTNAMNQRYRICTGKSANLDKVLYEWFKQQQSEGATITGFDICKRAREFHDELQLTENCTYSQGWLSRFKKRHGISKGKISNIESDSDSPAAEEIVAEWQETDSEKDSKICSIETVWSNSLVGTTLEKQNEEHDMDIVKNEQNTDLGVGIKLTEQLISFLEEKSFFGPEDILSIYKIKDKLMKEQLQKLTAKVE